jgi:hypothetical protein
LRLRLRTYRFVVTHTESRASILAHLPKDKACSVQGAVTVVVVPGAPVRLHVDDATTLRLTDASATNSAAAHWSQRCVARDLRLRVLDQFDNEAVFPPAPAVVTCALRYPADKDAQYGPDGDDELPALDGSVERLLAGQIDAERSTCVFSELPLAAGRGRGDGYVEAVFTLREEQGGRLRSVGSCEKWVLTFQFTTDQGASTLLPLPFIFPSFLLSAASLMLLFATPPPPHPSLTRRPH